MFCRNCGNQIDDQAAVCVKCGVRPHQGAAFCQACGKETPAGAVVCVQCGASLASTVRRVPGADRKIVAGICGILLGSLGVHKFVLGYTAAGIIMLLLTLLSCGVLSPIVGIIGLIEGIVYLAKPDEEFVRTYLDNEKQWF